MRRGEDTTLSLLIIECVPSQKSNQFLDENGNVGTDLRLGDGIGSEQLVQELEGSEIGSETNILDMRPVLEEP